MSSGTPSRTVPADAESLFNRVVEVVRADPKAFQDAGEWLNVRYSDEALAQRQVARRDRILRWAKWNRYLNRRGLSLKDRRPLLSDERRDLHRYGTDPAAWPLRKTSPIWRRFGMAVHELLDTLRPVDPQSTLPGGEGEGDLEYEKLAMTALQRRVVVLLAWVMADVGAERAPFRLTEFQKWSWDATETDPLSPETARSLQRGRWARKRRWLSLLADAMEGLPMPKSAQQAAAVGLNDTDQPSTSKQARALALLLEHRDWTDKQIAEAVPCNRTTLYKWREYVAAREALKQGRQEMPRGYRDPKTGRIEAIEPEGDTFGDT